MKVAVIAVAGALVWAAPAQAVPPKEAARIAERGINAFKASIAPHRPYTTISQSFKCHGSVTWTCPFSFRLRVQGWSAPISCQGNMGVTSDRKYKLLDYACVA